MNYSVMDARFILVKAEVLKLRLAKCILEASRGIDDALTLAI